MSIPSRRPARSVAPTEAAEESLAVGQAVRAESREWLCEVIKAFGLSFGWSLPLIDLSPGDLPPQWASLAITIPSRINR